MKARDPDLKTLGGRLRWAREQAGIPSATIAAEQLGVALATYNSHERAGLPGARNFSIDDAKKYARRLGISVCWLLTGEGFPYGKEVDQPPIPAPLRSPAAEAAVVAIFRKIGIQDTKAKAAAAAFLELLEAGIEPGKKLKLHEVAEYEVEKIVQKFGPRRTP